MRGLLTAVLLFGLLAVSAGPTPAGDQDLARACVAAGKARPLAEIMSGLRRDYPGRLLDARLRERRGGACTYGLKMLMPDGKVVALTVDARSGRVLSVKGQ